MIKKRTKYIKKHLYKHVKSTKNKVPESPDQKQYRNSIKQLRATFISVGKRITLLFNYYT